MILNAVSDPHQASLDQQDLRPAFPRLRVLRGPGGLSSLYAVRSRSATRATPLGLHSRSAYRVAPTSDGGYVLCTAYRCCMHFCALLSFGGLLATPPFYQFAIRLVASCITPITLAVEQGRYLKPSGCLSVTQKLKVHSARRYCCSLTPISSHGRTATRNEVAVAVLRYAVTSHVKPISHLL